jgi:hypothetical protein
MRPKKCMKFAPVGRPTRKSEAPLLAAYARRLAARRRGLSESAGGIPMSNSDDDVLARELGRVGELGGKLGELFSDGSALARLPR